ncbi:MAG: hypothetical protein ACFFDN_02620 [Candidatus Hodarchaeota archaeon]
MGTVVGAWRLKLILILIIFATLIYGSYAVFGNIDVVFYYEGNDTYYGAENQTIGYNQTDLGTEESSGFTDVLFGIGDFFTFGEIDNTWVRLSINVVMGCVWITIGYVIFTFVKEWIPFV